MFVFEVILVRIFPAFSRIRTEYGDRENARKMWTRITPNTDSFYAVHFPTLQTSALQFAYTNTIRKRVLFSTNQRVTRTKQKYHVYHIMYYMLCNWSKINSYQSWSFRSSHPEVFYKIFVLHLRSKWIKNYKLHSSMFIKINTLTSIFREFSSQVQKTT